MKCEDRERPIEGCNCLNCRLERMESAIGKMNDSVAVILERRDWIPGMPEERNRIRKK